MTSQVSLVEFLQPVRTGSHRARVLSTMHWLQVVAGESSISTAQIREALKATKIRGASKANVADVLARAEHRVVHDPTSRTWQLTGPGRDYVTAELGLSLGTAQAPAADDVRAVVGTITDGVARGYVEEAVVCLEAGALRAAVVFLWSGAIRVLQEEAVLMGASQVTAAVQKHDPKCPGVKKLDDFSKVRDRVALLAFRDLGMIDKGEWATLQEGLDLRNRCGHPTKYKPGLAKTRAFIEDMIGIVF